MSWKRLGRIVVIDGFAEWMKSHSANPVPFGVTKSKCSILFNCRDGSNRSYVAMLDFDLSRRQVLRIHDRPVLEPGGAGSFDESGVSLGSVVEKDSESWLYYVGWRLGVDDHPWRNTIGLATGRIGTVELQRHGSGPVIDVSPEDPYSMSYPFVLRDEGRWRMWYGSNPDWGDDGKTMRHHIKYAESTDGLTWRRQKAPCMSLTDADQALSRPMVIRDGERYRMWYSGRGDRYRIGYAESKDGRQWKRLDDLGGLRPSQSGWDSEMTCYPYVVDFQGRRYMFYCGNGFGRSGMGLALWQS